MEETLSTLDYAIRAKSIRNRPEVNQHMTRTGLLKEYLGDIDRLKNELMAARDKNGIYIPEDQWREMHDERVKQKSEFEEAVFRANACTVELASKKKEFEDLSVKMLSTARDLEEAREKEKELKELMVVVERELGVKRKELEEERAVSEAYMLGEERLDAVAGGLKRVAMESVGDVGGLFEKLGELYSSV
jgi:kinesin family protein 11